MPEPSNYQLYVLIRNKKLQPAIRRAAQALWDARHVNEAEQQQLKKRWDNFSRPEQDRPMKMKFRLLVLFFPFAPETGILQAFISSCLLAYGHRKKWRNYWNAVMLGHLLWLIALTLLFYLLR